MAPDKRPERVAARVKAAQRKADNDRIQSALGSGTKPMDIDFR